MLGGYSTIWLGRALPAGGRLITLEASAEYAEVARGSRVSATTIQTVGAKGYDGFTIALLDGR